MNDAACGDGVVDVIKFASPSDEQDAAEAIMTCTVACPVLDVCRKFASSTGQDRGVWGGVWLDRPQREQAG